MRHELKREDRRMETMKRCDGAWMRRKEIERGVRGREEDEKRKRRGDGEVGKKKWKEVGRGREGRDLIGGIEKTS